jgi:hypothetical protein
MTIERFKEKGDPVYKEFLTVFYEITDMENPDTYIEKFINYKEDFSNYHVIDMLKGFRWFIRGVCFQKEHAISSSSEFKEMSDNELHNHIEEIKARMETCQKNIDDLSKRKSFMDITIAKMEEKLSKHD